LAGLALLTKYQALVPLLGILFALQRSGELSDKQNLRGLGIAVLVACLIFLPHFVWLYVNDFPTLQYAKRSAQNLGVFARVKTLFSFLFNLIRFYLPIVIAFGLAFGYARSRRRPAMSVNVDSTDPCISIWMWGLIGIPAIFLVLMALLGGVRLEGHWGMQTFQFLCLLFVWQFKTVVDRISTNYFIVAAVLVHFIYMSLYYQSYESELAHAPRKRVDRIYPAQALADQATLDWRKATRCPLKYVVGPTYEAGIISLYSGSFPAVKEEQVDGDPAKSPWIKSSDIATYGAIQVWIQPDKAPVGIIADGTMDIPGLLDDGSASQKVYWHIALPQQPCTGSVQ
jgi:hypothetical protein